MSRAALIALLISALCLLPQLAQAQAEYQNLVEKGLQEFELGNYSEARTFFQRAHQLSPSARTLRGLGVTSYELRHYVEAQEYLQQALTSDVRPLTQELRAEVSVLLGQARSFIGKLQLTVSPAHAQVRIDTHDVYRDAAGMILLDPGTHELTVEAPHYDAVTRSIRCDGSETLALAVRLPKASTHVAAPSNSAAPSDVRAVAPYVLIAGSAAVAVAGGVLLTIALVNKHAAENPDQSGHDGPHYADYQGKADSVTPLSAAGIGALCAGGVGLAAGLLWRLGSHSTTTSLAITPTGLAVRGRY